MVSTLERWLTEHLRPVLASILALGLVLRVVYFVQVNSGPLVAQHQWIETDMHFFDQWAKTIAAGDWLTDRALHPQHQWHVQVAARALGLPEGTVLDDRMTERARLLWDRWYGGKVFHQEPLYPYLIAVTYRIFGPDVRWVFGWQLALGLLSIVLVFRIARRHFGVLTATVAAALAALSGPLLYYEAILLRSALITFLGLLLVDRVDLALTEKRLSAWALVGFLSGLAILLTSSFALFAVGAFVALVVTTWTARGLLARRSAVLLAGVALALAPLVARNAVVGVSPLATSSVGPVTFVNANTADFPPELGFFVSQHTARIMSETGGRFVPAVWATLRTHPGLGSYLSQLVRKLTLVFHWYEVPNNSNYYLYRTHAPVLAVLLTFFVLAPLSLLGVGLAASRWRSTWPLGLLVANHLAIMLGFYVLSRFRVSLLAALLPFAAFGLVQLLRAAEARRLRWVGTALVALVLLGFWTGRPLADDRHPIRSEDYASLYASYLPRIRSAVARNDWGSVTALIQDALRFEAPLARELGPDRRANDRHESTMARFYANVHRSHALALRNLGRATEAEAAEQRALRLLQATAQP